MGNLISLDSDSNIPIGELRKLASEKKWLGRAWKIILFLGLVALAVGSSVFYSNKIFKEFAGGIITFFAGISAFPLAYAVKEEEKSRREELRRAAPDPTYVPPRQEVEVDYGPKGLLLEESRNICATPIIECLLGHRPPTERQHEGLGKIIKHYTSVAYVDNPKKEDWTVPFAHKLMDKIFTEAWEQSLIDRKDPGIMRESTHWAVIASNLYQYARNVSS